MRRPSSINILITLAILSFSTTLLAQDNQPGISDMNALDIHVQTPQYEFLRLADAGPTDSGAMTHEGMTGNMTTDGSGINPQYHDRWLTANKMHKYLGIGSIAMAALAVISPKGYDGAHENFARGAAALGGAALATGLVFHFEDLSFSNAIDNPDNQHALFAALGAVGFGLAVSKGGESGHVGLGVAGGLAMLYGIKVTW